MTIKIKPINIVLCGMFAALTAVFSQIGIPIPMIPINLATFSVLCAGLLLGSKIGALSQLIYVLIGLAGAPVFSSMRGGAAVIAGPTGGYIIGYVLAAFTAGFIAERFRYSPVSIIVALAAGYITYTLLGTVWFMILMKADLITALSTCVVPYIAGDFIKIAVVRLIIPKIRKIMIKA